MPRAAASAGRARDEAIGAQECSREDWLEQYQSVRGETERRAAPLSGEDQVVQSMPDASPIKWHRAHTSWFFEQFLLLPHLRGYQVFDQRFAYLFNSYYVAAGPRHARPKRGLLTRPSIAEISEYRTYVDAAVIGLLGNSSKSQLEAILPIVELGLNHEQQHQELMLTDILHAFSENPNCPVYCKMAPLAELADNPHDDVELPEGIYTVGHYGSGFSFDNERPAHRVLIGPVKVARGLVSNAEWSAFIADGGYRRPELWLSDGWTKVQEEAWTAPGYWREIDGRFFTMTLAGLRPVVLTAPVCHISYYEADAFARWAGKSLPNELEWEVAARAGNLAGILAPVWQWTRSAYAPYPGYRPAKGALGEYNGKFMINQMVLRGGSLATPQGHSRVSYRNFFYPSARWQFSGVRLAAYN